ncbi:MAG: phage holin family protein [Methylicorpusculum sp.]|uniref:phage holin family protein n=1 Tax=Methylicorpusculum sp. TaxID=2713644 RepID=UPI002717A019|nr:phage holin family protein [Methylicorpusculum sp.]MDO8940312.1 phage holin family protein [Methylicorpusculum sp.]MDO9240902.1 phage holin family protein [Methylicorpusculum sp.]MDP2179194.1 phage holin family protein [Methylicorpusculum sp.]MDP2203590.1 phage holin family protein [Methylicorpusculum sp.]MDP3531339.1 phage holin family protein [Methylicorpusculum sp.]
MKPDALKQGPPAHCETRCDPGTSSDRQEESLSLLRELGGLIHDRFRLAALELQWARKSFVDRVVAGVMVGVLLMGAWLGLMAAAVLEFVKHEVLATSSALLLAVTSNLLLVLILGSVIRRKRRYLHFPATLHSFQATPSGQRDMG